MIVTDSWQYSAIRVVFASRSDSVPRMRTGRDPFPNLVEMVHEAALEPALWRQVAATASTVFCAAHVRLGANDRHGGLVLYAQSHELSSRVPVRPSYLIKKNPGVAFVAATPPMTVAGREQLISDRDRERLDFYHEAMRPFQFWHAGHGQHALRRNAARANGALADA
jgi:hypothetical protein